MRKLERNIGTTLFFRTSRHVRLTVAGEAFLGGAMRVLSDVADLSAIVAEHTGTLRGRVTIGTIKYVSEYRLPAVIAAFRRRYPGVDVYLRENVTAALLNGLRNEDVDFAIVHADAVRHASDLAIEPIGLDDLGIALWPTHRFATRRQLRIEDLRDESFIAYHTGSGVRTILFRAAAEAGFTPRIVCETTSSTTLRALVKEGIGVALVPRSHIEIAGPSLIDIRLIPRLVWQYVLATRQAPMHNPAAYAFLATMKTEFRANVLAKGEDA